MKKLLLTTMAATMMSTAAIATVTVDTSSNDYIVGRIHKGVQIANHFEARDINIVENGQGQIRVSQTVNAWNDAWNAADDNNSIDLGERISQTYLGLWNGDFVITGTYDPRFEYVYGTYDPDNPIFADDDAIDIDNRTITYANNDGVEIVNADIDWTHTQTVSTVDDRARIMNVVDYLSGTADPYNTLDISFIDPTTIDRGYYRSLEALSVGNNHTFEELKRAVIEGAERIYDTGFSDGYTAGYNDGFAAAKAVVTNGD